MKVISVLRYLRLMMFEKALYALVRGEGRLNYAVFSCKRGEKVVSIEVLAERNKGDIWIGISVPSTDLTQLKKLRDFVGNELKKELITANDMYWIRSRVEEAVMIIERIFTKFFELPENYEPIIELHIEGVGDFIIDRLSTRRAEILSINLLSYYNGKDMKRIKVTKEFFGNLRKDEIESIRFKSGVLRASMEVALRNGQVIKYVIPKRSLLEYKRKLIALGYKVGD